MWAKPTKKDFANMPAMASNENTKLADIIIVGHFFVASCDWYIAEYNPKEQLFFGYVNLGNDELSEWGYFSYKELQSLKVSGFMEVDFDKYWDKVAASEIDKIIIK